MGDDNVSTRMMHEHPTKQYHLQSMGRFLFHAGGMKSDFSRDGNCPDGRLRFQTRVSVCQANLLFQL